MDPSRPGERMSIGAVSRELAIPIPTIRSWERRYGFPAPPRTGGKHRRYGERELEQLRDLRDLITRGYTARQAVARAAAGGASADGSDLAAELVGAAMRLDSGEVRAVLERSAERLGVEGTIRDVAFAAMREIGTRWKTGTCEVEHEHLATEAVRGWFARQAAMSPPASGADPIVLACGPKDLHSLGLEGFGAILAGRGWPCRVLGAMTPTSALLSVLRNLRAPAAVVTAQRGVTRRAAIGSIAAVEEMPGVRAFYAGDAFIAPSARRGVPGTYLGDDVVEAARTLESALGFGTLASAYAGTSTIGSG